MEIKNRPVYAAISSNAEIFGRNLIGACLILILALLVLQMVILPEILRLFKQALVSNATAVWVSALGSIIIVGILLGFPIFLIVEGLNAFRAADELARLGKLVKGIISEKWVEVSAGTRIYHVLYQYSLGLNAIQIVEERVFQSLHYNQSVDVLCLPYAPHISRLELSV